METIIHALIVMILSLVAVAIAYRVPHIHRYVFGHGSAKFVNAANQAAAAAPGVK